MPHVFRKVTVCCRVTCLFLPLPPLSFPEDRRCFVSEPAGFGPTHPLLFRTEDKFSPSSLSEAILYLRERWPERRWNEAFLRDYFHAELSLAICGHAMLEKYLSPYKSMTAKALLIHVDSDFMALPRPEILKRLDDETARRLLAGEILTKPACLTPLPLAGVPGWWPCAEQSDTEFYTDLQVFRRPPVNLIPAPVASF